MSQTVRLGPAALRLSGSGFGFAEVASELEAVRETSAGAVDAEIRIGSGLPEDFEPKVYSAKGRFNFDEQRFFRADPVAHRVSTWSGTQSCVAEFAVRRPKKPRLLELQRTSPIMTYALFWGLMHFVLGRQGAGFVHAGIATRGQGSSCFVGTGGCGKTSSLFSLLQDEHERYQAEDFGLISRSGHSYYCPKHVSIYATDTRSAILAKAVDTELTFRQKRVWQYRKLRGNPRIKLSPRALVGDRIAAKDEIARVFYLVRGVNSSVEIKPLSVEELAERAASVAQRELAAWAENLLLIAANDVIGAAFPTWAQVGEQLRALYRAAFARAERSLVLVPHRCSGEDLLDALFAARKLTR